MPHVSPYEAATDEPKTYKDEAIGGDDSNDLNDIKGDLVAEDDEVVQQSYEKKSPMHQPDSSKENVTGAHQLNSEARRLNFPYPAQFDRFASSMSHPFFQGNFLPPSTQVPYSHYVPPYMGSFLCGPASVDLDRKQGLPGISYPEVNPMYPLPGQLGQIPNPLAPWPTSSLYPLCTATMTGMLRYPYPFHHFSSSGGVSPFPRTPLPTNGIRPGSVRPESHPGRHVTDINKATDKKSSDLSKRSKNNSKSNRPYVKKPLNAFMIYMKEQRARVVAECTLKESAAINQILGKKWHSLDKEEQQKYYELARKERQLHMQLHPSWSARDNYGKRKKRKKEKVQDCTGLNAKKCRAVFGLEQQHLWCAPCRRKKKCIRTHPDGDDSDDSDSSLSHYTSLPDCSSSQSQPISSFDSSTFSHADQSSFSGNSQSRPVNFSTDSSSGQSASMIHVKREKVSPVAGTSRLSSIESIAQESSTTSSDTKEHKPPSSGRDFEDGLRKLTNSFSSTQTVTDKRKYRASSNSDLSSTSYSSSNGGKPNLYASPLLSPSNVNIASPPSNSALLPNLSYLAAAAGIPPSPLGGLIGFPNFNGLASPMHIGLNNPSSPIGPIGHVTSTASLMTSSALEGRS